MKKYLLAALALTVLCIPSNAKKKEVKEVLFGVKSGVITISNDMGEMPDFGGMGMDFGAMGGDFGGFGDFNLNDMTEKIYFDDYGRKTATVTIMSNRTTRTVAIGDSTYTINETANTATVMPQFGRGRGGFGGFGMMGGGVSVGTIGQIDWLNLDKKTVKKNKITEIGEQQVGGKMCKKYTMKQSYQGYTTNITVCIYEGIPFYTETQNEWSTVPQTSAVVAFEETDVPASMFLLPEGCEVSEPTFLGMGGGFGGDFGGFGGDFGGFGGGFGGGMGGFGGF